MISNAEVIITNAVNLMQIYFYKTSFTRVPVKELKVCVVRLADT